ncbi:hybrid sensor histidine kinase/response regulator [Actinoplanes subtropicus]|uniref:hybrid sensor histidine kinase/response regulator n=1 Tax=Actinoplanes subtropicus TaxID=543632 RepID=UPI00068B8789|nr:ATP-binding protein [Actinoplanes subtropicus]
MTGWTDTWWQLTALANAVILAAYLAISFAIGRGLWRSRQWRNNPLGLATAAIFFSCAVHHGSHTVHLLLPYFGKDVHGGLAMRMAFGMDFQAATWDTVTAVLAVWYWTLRGRFPALVRGAALFEDLRLRQAAEADLRASEERFREIVETTSEGVVVLDGDGRIGYTNDRFAVLVGRSPDDLPGTPVLDLVTETDRPVAEQALAAVGESEAPHVEVGLQTPGARAVWARIALSARVDDAGRPVGALAMVADVTERKSIEAQLQQAQKLEAVGQLAGGLAHDFNNLLTVIDGYAALLIAEAGPSAQGDLAMIRDAAARASALTRQLLTFSRAQTARPQVVDVADLVAGVEVLLRRLIREDVDLLVTPAAAPTPVRVDPGQLEQVLVNLAINARDAMPAGGVLTIGTERVTSSTGDEVLITVTDTGCGMTGEVAARVFEPFFTTKDQGQGTGLGLSTVYGIVTRAGGRIRVDSRPGEGATFEVRLPVAAAPATAVAEPAGPQRLTAGSGTILLVEDDPAVRRLAERILATAGYHVLAGVDGEHALAVARAHPVIDLLVTDVIMPGMNGQQLADRLTALRPGLPVIFTSAYTRGVLTETVDDRTVAFLDKPFTAAALTEKIRSVLDRRADRTASRV